MGESKKKSSCADACCSGSTPQPQKEVKENCCSSGCCASGNALEVVEQDDCCKPSASNNEEGSKVAADVIPQLDECCKPAEPIDSTGCQDGCCKPKKEINIEDPCCDTPNVAVKNSTGCCSSQDEQDGQDNCCGPAKAVVDNCCQDSCCGTQEKVDKEECCGPPDDISQDTCQDGCCSADKPTAIEPSCCEGKQKPCCDTTCIDRLVLRETAEEAGQGNDAAGSSAQGSASSREKSIRERYETRLAAIGCLCRALIALGQESCCVSPEVSSVERKRGSKKGSKKCLRPKSQDKQESTCKSEVAGTCCSPAVQRKSSVSSHRRAKSCSKGCCGKAESTNITIVEKDTCCSKNSSSQGSDCQQEKSIAIENLPQKDGSEDVKIANLEKGMSGSEYVVLGITGMTCTGCETKLQQTLKRFKAVNNLKTSLVMARVQFQLDLRLAAPEDVIKHIERTTEFKCEKIATSGSTLDVVPVHGSKNFVQESPPLGVKSIDIVDEQIVRITFDPEVIGARDLINKGFKTPQALAPPRADPSLAAGSKHVQHMGWMTLASILLTIPVLVLAWAPLKERPVTYGSVSLALATIVQVFIAGPFYPKALKSLVFSRVVEMDLLIVLSTTAAYTFSVVSFGYQVSGQPLPTGNFFETSTLLVTLIMVGRWVSALARQKAVESISIRALQASTATLVSQDGTEIDIDTRLLQYGDIFKVVPHTQIPTDGVVLSGITEVDESMLTGESRLVEKRIGSTAIAGSLNGSGTITARLTRLPGENTISTIAGMVDDAKLSKPKIQGLADRVASYFVPVVISLTIVVFVAWVGVGIRNQGMPGSEAVTQAITYGITVLIVSCPCAIGLAVPMVIVIACGAAAERGLIFKESEALEVAYKASHIVFDKTGTLTEGKLSVVSEVYPSETQETVTPKILGLLADINHPVSSAVTAHLKNRAVNAAKVNEIKSLPGKGVEGNTGKAAIKAGNSRWLGTESHPLVQDVLSKGHTTFCVTIGSELQAVFGLADTIRSDAASVVAKLQKRNIAVSILSGDDESAVQAVALNLGIPGGNAMSRCSPADKQAYIQKLLNDRSGKHDKKQPVIVFVGDGTNDAVALTQATIGVHVNSGTDVAKSAADVVLMRPSLGGILAMIDVSRAAVRRITFNFGWSAVYNVFAILLAAGAFVGAGKGGVRIPPEFAGLGELVSVLPVIMVALSLRWARI
ncbi:heavy metal translocatin [Hypoxylon trugodes]|uniref:heavy metal translocatin n=1 Tax=Hypoxylon trugodes TaxID=326681 RepID=UPI00219CD4F5|nr:heavy metal translocatin [Hypoxylon trugodes]KAI1383118.1 heavy metal translocatin [Hypoxylon trugodes]